MVIHMLTYFQMHKNNSQRIDTHTHREQPVAHSKYSEEFEQIYTNIYIEFVCMANIYLEQIRLVYMHRSQ